MVTKPKITMLFIQPFYYLHVFIECHFYNLILFYMKKFTLPFILFSCLLFAAIVVSGQSAHADYDTTGMNTSVTIDVRTNDGYSPNYCTVLFTNSGAAGNPQYGTVTVSGQNIVYAPDSGFYGNDHFLYGIVVCGTNTVVDSAWVYVTVVGNTAMLVTSVNTTNSTPTSCDGSVSIAITGGTPPYDVMFNGAIHTVSSNVFYLDSLCPGTYVATVGDQQQQTISVTFTIGGGTNAMTVDVSTVPSGSNTCTGAAEAIVTGGTTPYQYLWSTGETNAGITGLCPGSYTVTVTDATGVSVHNTGTVYADSIPANNFYATVTTVNVTSSGVCDGAANIHFYNGTAPYYIQFNGMTYTTSDAFYTFDQLCTGTYTIAVYDNLQNNTTVTFVITGNNTTGLTVEAVTTTNAGTNECNGTAVISVSGGFPPYTYHYFLSNTSNPVSGTDFIDSLCHGTYSVIVTDSAGTHIQASFTIYEDAVTPNDSLLWVQVYAGDGQTMPPGCIGYAEAVIYGGTAPYTYSWNTGATTNHLFNICPGYYCVTVTDANGLSASGCSYYIEDSLNVVPSDTLVSQVDTCFITTPIDSAFVNAVITNSNGQVNVQWVIVMNGQTYIVDVPYNITSAGTYNMTLVINCSGGSKNLVVLNDNYTVTPDELLYTAYIKTASEELAIYPNPVTDYFRVNGIERVKTISIISMNSKVINVYSAAHISSGINVSNLTHGVYSVVIVMNDGSTIIKRIVK